MEILNSISAIYDAAINPVCWDDALDECVKFVGARSATMVVVEKDPENPTMVGNRSKVFRDLKPEIVEYYVENLMHYERDGWENVMASPKQTIFTDEDSWAQPASDLIKREDYAYLYRHVKIFRKYVARLNDNRAWTDNIAFQFDTKFENVPKSSIKLGYQLLPHMAKSVELARTYSILQKQYNAVLTALDNVEVGICIVQRNGSVIISNTEAERILSMKDGIKLSRTGHIFCEDSEKNSTIKNAIEETSSTAAGGNELYEKTLSIQRPSGKPAFIMEISPLSDSAAEIEKYLKGSLIILIDPTNHASFEVSRVALAYELTNTEATISKYLVDGWKNYDIAEDRNVSVETVKTQIASILRKTGTQGRSELIRLALKTSPPIKKPGELKL